MTRRARGATVIAVVGAAAFAGVVRAGQRPADAPPLVQLQTMPEAFEWVWKGYKPRGR